MILYEQTLVKMYNCIQLASILEIFKSFVISKGLVWRNINFQKSLAVTEGLNFSVSYDVSTNIHPNVSWFKDNQIISYGFNMTTEVTGIESNLTVYRITLYKNIIGFNDGGVYHAMATFGPMQYNSTSFTIKVEGKYSHLHFSFAPLPFCKAFAGYSSSSFTGYDCSYCYRHDFCYSYSCSDLLFFSTTKSKQNKYKLQKYNSILLQHLQR